MPWIGQKTGQYDTRNVPALLPLCASSIAVDVQLMLILVGKQGRSN